jgi:hypothetical protein
MVTFYSYKALETEEKETCFPIAKDGWLGKDQDQDQDQEAKRNTWYRLVSECITSPEPVHSTLLQSPSTKVTSSGRNMRKWDEGVARLHISDLASLSPQVPLADSFSRRHPPVSTLESASSPKHLYLMPSCSNAD